MFSGIHLTAILHGVLINLTRHIFRITAIELEVPQRQSIVRPETNLRVIFNRECSPDNMVPSHPCRSYREISQSLEGDR